MPTNRRRRFAVAHAVRSACVVVGLGSLGLLGGCGEKPLTGDGAMVETARVGDPAEKSNPDAIRPGELLDVFVMEDDSFSGRYQVRSQGDIIVPKLGRVRVGGMSVASAEASLKRALEKSQLKSPTVILDRAIVPGTQEAQAAGSGVEVFLSGKVVHPGRYTVTGVAESPPTVHQAVLQAGGCSRFAYKRKAHILRKTPDGRLSKIDTDLQAIEDGEASDVPLAPGDIIVVPEKKIDFGI